MTSPHPVIENDLAELLQGEWMIGATNFPIWLNGSRLSPTFEYRVRGRSPLVLEDTVAYVSPDGVRTTTGGVDRWRGDRFIRRGSARRGLFASRWAITAADDDGDFAVIRFFKSFATHAGLAVIARASVDPHDLRTAVATDPGRYDIGHEEFAGLTWLDYAAAAPSR
jgi:hypothetical protein